MKAGLIADTYLEATHISSMKKAYASTVLSGDLQDQVSSLAANAHVYDILSKSIAPEIFGHEDVKKALLLLMVGGVTKGMSDGMKIRGLFFSIQLRLLSPSISS